MIKSNNKSKFQIKLLEYINNTLLKNNELYFNNISENIDDENINEAGGVAGIPIVSGIHKLYNDLNGIIKNTDSHSPDVSNVKTRVNFGPAGIKTVNCKKYVIRVKFNDSEYGFDSLINMPNSVIVCRITDVEITNPLYAIMFKEQIGSKNYYRLQLSDVLDNGKYIKSDPETIGIDVMSVNGKICPKSFYASFLHEFNHLFQDYNQYLNNSRREYVKKYRINNAIQLISNDVDLTDEDKRCLQRILSTIMNDTEINAYAAGHFGELIGSEVTYDEYNKFIQRSNVWNHILNIESCIKHVLDFDDDKFVKIYNVIKDTQFNELFSSDKIDKTNFKKAFKRNLFKRIQKLIDTTTKVASYYFGMLSSYNNKEQVS